MDADPADAPTAPADDRFRVVIAGARGVEQLPGALTYGGANANDAYRLLLGELESGAAIRVVFAVAAGLHWGTAAV